MRHSRARWCRGGGRAGGRREAGPTGPAAGWWPVLLLVPAAVGVLEGLDLARTSTDGITAPW
ncbi:hypothetical protein, partial [Nocardia abscessus]|uniref:hypothetical protein n=1 Tax=Nocardia abscessus TaxID=120957 RepID=UPI0024588AD7